MKTAETMKHTGAIWRSKTEYYDIETGEQITKNNAVTNYIKIKTNRHVELNESKTRGIISYAIECRRNPQTKLY